MYTQKILDIFKSPLNAGGLQGANGVGKYVDEGCGDYIKLYLKINEEEVIQEARFKAIGSVGTIVAGSAICSCLLDCTLEEALEINEDRICEVTGEFPQDKKYSLTFALNALKNAVDNYYNNLAKMQKKASEPPVQVKVEKQPAKEYAEVQQRRSVSSAKANFDAMFDL